MKKALFTFASLCFSLMALAQTQYDYYDDDAVAGGADRALNGFIILFLIVVALVVIIFILGGISKIMYELSPQSTIDRQKKEKEEKEKQERIRKEEERKKALLALPENTIKLLIEAKPHLVELAGAANRIHTSALAICLSSINRIYWEGKEITEQVGYIDKPIDFYYGRHYETPHDKFNHLYELIVSEHCAKLADQSNVTSFEIEFTIRGDFDPQKFKILSHKHYGLRHHNIERNIKCLEFVFYNGDVLQAHLTNGEPICFPYTGYNSYPIF